MRARDATKLYNSKPLFRRLEDLVFAVAFSCLLIGGLFGLLLARAFGWGAGL